MTVDVIVESCDCVGMPTWAAVFFQVLKMCSSEITFQNKKISAMGSASSQLTVS